MSTRLLAPAFIGVVVAGSVAAGGLTMAAAATALTVANSSARYVPPSGAAAGKFTFTADVRDDSGVRGLKVVAWPAASKLNPTSQELRYADNATCRSTSGGRSHCTYTLKVTKREAAGLAGGTWHVSVLATAKDGGTKFVARAATVRISR